MGGNAAHAGWTSLEVQGEVPAVFPEFERMFID